MKMKIKIKEKIIKKLIIKNNNNLLSKFNKIN